jgi:protein subunit release factor B
MLMRMYLRWAERHRFITQVVECNWVKKQA